MANRKYKIANNIIVLDGKKEDIVVGNASKFRFLHVENGKACVEAINNAKKGKFDSIDDRLHRLLCQHNILVCNDNGLKQPPLKSSICSGKIGEQTLILPSEPIYKDVYEKSLNYAFEITEKDSFLTIGFHSQALLLVWDNIEEITKLAVDKQTTDRPDIKIKYHFSSTLEALPARILEWLEDKDVCFEVFFPILGGLRDLASPPKEDVIENIKQLSEKGVSFSFITPVTKNNVHELPSIAKFYTELGVKGSFEFPAIHDPVHPWEYRQQDCLPDSDDYSRALVDVYKQGHTGDFRFTIANQLRHRITHGAYSDNCACSYDNVTVVDNNGDVYPCLAAINSKIMLTGNIRHDAEANYAKAHGEYEEVKKASWRKCSKCIWKGLCGGYCPLVNYTAESTPLKYRDEEIEGYICKPRQLLIKAIIWDMVEDINQGKVQTEVFSDTTSPRTILVMLSSDSSLPCYEFNGKTKKPKAELSSKKLKDILLLAVKKNDTEIPEILFLASASESLDRSVAAILEDMGDHIITPLLNRDKQKSLRIPFSHNQTVVANSLKTLIEKKNSIQNRSVVLHIERNEISNLAEQLLSIQDLLHKITLRLKDMHLLEEQDMQEYKSQLDRLTDISFMKKASGTEHSFDITNIDIISSTSNHSGRCPAGSEFVAVAPDGLIYPCPAFYHEKGSHCFGPVSNIVKASFAVNWSRKKCGICNLSECPGCPFLELQQANGKEKLCKVYQAERNAKRDLVMRIARSGYMFDCLRTLKTQQFRARSLAEGREDLIADSHVHDIKFEEFTSALKDLESAVTSAFNGRQAADKVSDRWNELAEMPADAPKNIFRQRVQETLKQIEML